MDTNMYSLNTGGQNTTQSSAQRKFYQWVLKWINGVQLYNDSNCEESQEFRNPTRPDVPTLACFLQVIGFKLLSFEKPAEIEEKCENKDSQTGDITITIECGTSNMKAILELNKVTCQCPNPDHVKDASFWSISGTGPTGSIDNLAQKVEETGSNLLPQVSKEVAKVMRDVSYRLFETIACEPDLNRNTDTNLNISRTENRSYERNKSVHEIPRREIGVMRSHTQPEMRVRSDSISSKSLSECGGRSTNSDASINRNTSPASRGKPPFQRQKTWDIDIETKSLDGEPRPSPPKITSSPAMIAELSNSLGQISLPEEIQNPKNVAEYIIGAQQNLEKALKMLSLEKTTILDELSPNKDQDTASVKSATAVVNSPYTSSGLNTTRTTKQLPKLNYPTHEQFARTGTQTPKARRNIETIMSKSVTRKSIQLETGNVKAFNRRRSLGIPLAISNSDSTLMPKSLTTDSTQKTSGSSEYSATKSGSFSGSMNRSYSTTKRRVSPEPQQSSASPITKTVNAPTARTPSMLKPPTKISISKSIPKLKTMQSSRVNTGIAAKSRINLEKE